MPIDLINELLFEGWLASEASDEGHPVVKLLALVVVILPLLIVLDDVDVSRHDLRKEHDANKHEQHSEHLLLDRNWIVVTIASS
jgi:hypothetical protein